MLLNHLLAWNFYISLHADTCCGRRAACAVSILTVTANSSNLMSTMQNIGMFSRKRLVLFGCLVMTLGFYFSTHHHFRHRQEAVKVQIVDSVPPEKANILIIGAGLSGAVLADLYARKQGKSVLIIEKREHIAGNCFDFNDESTGILRSKYGAHLFHTNMERVWRYVNQYTEWEQYEHRVVGYVDDMYVPIPASIETVNTLFSKHVTSVPEMQTFMTKEREGVSQEQPQNSRDVGMQRVGSRLFNKLFYEYTRKQWDVKPEQLDASVLARIPVRENWDDRYFPGDKFQGLPKHGYTSWFTKMLSHDKIKVMLNTNMFDLISSGKLDPDFSGFDRVIFTGQIDQLIHHRRDVDLPKLRYRSIKFEDQVLSSSVTNLSAFVVNYPQAKDGAFTRIVEYKHCYQQQGDKTVLVREFSSDEGEPYYPFPDEENRQLFEKYKEVALQDDLLLDKVSFAGRLANYKYYNMDQAIDAALSLYTDLEGPKSLDYIADLPLVDLREKMQVHVIVNFFDEDMSWISHLVKQLYSELGNSIFVRFFAYSKLPGRSHEHFRKGVLHYLRRYQTPEELAKNYFAVLPNIGREGHSWLTYMMSNTHAFGDANIFLQGSKEASPEYIVKHVVAIKRQLFDRRASRGSDPAIVDTDIHNVEDYLTHKSVEQLASMQVDPTSPIEHSLHFRSLHPVFDNYKDELVVFKTAPSVVDEIKKSLCGTFSDFFAREVKATRTCETIHTCYRGEFVVTDAALRRALAKYRTPLLKLRAALETENNPLIGHALERLWLRLFRYQ